ncbi:MULTISPECIES: alpha/beta fold hydrolase [unclassified Arthrobacter]|uniref:alpha/beta fold hydrolase n=1 Tax=unclassified Arthrobacter TaxID=235627 RepID=UPI001492E017|nr:MULTISPECIES: alpha/beta hydrolase [unclassified Arthrobacter]MBE0008456.1 alpha/beta hydrolase [Arthrobacter sp. AET 35A]NOJ62196.1 alpha/beta hydrolase [Arthrobacter sp. 147(2020)]
MSQGSVLQRNNVTELGCADGPVVVFAHGFGTDQGMWSKILPYFVGKYRVILFDHVGAGGSDLKAYDSIKYSDLLGYVNDLLEIFEELDLRNVTLVGHSISAMLAVTVAAGPSERLDRVVLLAASPSYMDRPEDGYVGGFSQEDLEELFESLDANYVVWASRMAPVFMNAPHDPGLGMELEQRFHKTNPLIAGEFARVSFLTDVRHLLGQVKVPTLIMQCADDVVVPPHIGRYLVDHIPLSTLVNMKAKGHFPQSSASEETATTMLNFLEQVSPEPVPVG